MQRLDPVRAGEITDLLLASLGGDELRFMLRDCGHLTACVKQARRTIAQCDARQGRCYQSPRSRDYRPFCLLWLSCVITSSC